jgi:hypothetical protein
MTILFVKVMHLKHWRRSGQFLFLLLFFSEKMHFLSLSLFLVLAASACNVFIYKDWLANDWDTSANQCAVDFVAHPTEESYEIPTEESIESTSTEEITERGQDDYQCGPLMRTKCLENGSVTLYSTDLPLEVEYPVDFMVF